MLFALHGQTTFHNNLLSDIRLARDAGFDGLEVITEKLWRYVRAGLNVEDLDAAFRKYAIRPVCLDIIGDVERIDPEGRKHLLEETERLCEIAHRLHCPTIQINPFCGLAGRPWQEIIQLTAENVIEIAQIGQRYGIRFQLEGAAWTPIHSLAQCLELLAEVACDNVGLVLDFWHLWAGGETSPDEVARLDKSLIYGVHFCDGFRPEHGKEWPDEKLLRDVLPGDGKIPLKEWVAAVQATGFDGVWSTELLGSKYWERDHVELANDMRMRLERYTF